MKDLDLTHHELDVLARIKELLVELGLSEKNVRRVFVFIRNVLCLKQD